MASSAQVGAQSPAPDPGAAAQTRQSTAAAGVAAIGPGARRGGLVARGNAVLPSDLRVAGPAPGGATSPHRSHTDLGEAARAAGPSEWVSPHLWMLLWTTG